MNNLAVNLQQLQMQITQMSKNQTKLIAVSKNVSIDNIINAYNCGQIAFAENYIQELRDKISQLSQYHIEWHFIGKLQTNKIKFIAKDISWVHSIENTKQIMLLNKYRAGVNSKLNILIEVNLSGENTRGGINSLDEIIALAQVIHTQDNLILRGLMGMAIHTDNIDVIRQQFSQLHEYKNSLNNWGYNVDTLSMGMSNDYKIALECGATMLRIGSKIFGERIYAK